VSRRRTRDAEDEEDEERPAWMDGKVGDERDGDEQVNGLGATATDNIIGRALDRGEQWNAIDGRNDHLIGGRKENELVIGMDERRWRSTMYLDGRSNLDGQRAQGAGDSVASGRRAQLAGTAGAMITRSAGQRNEWI